MRELLTVGLVNGITAGCSFCGYRTVFLDLADGRRIGLRITKEQMTDLVNFLAPERAEGQRLCCRTCAQSDNDPGKSQVDGSSVPSGPTQ